MKLSLAMLLSATILAGCATTSETAKPGDMAAAAPVAAAPAAKPAYGSFGFDEAGMDRSVQPGDNFYNYASGTWTKNTPIPADKSNYGAFNILSDLSEARTREILDGVAGDSKLNLPDGMHPTAEGVDVVVRKILPTVEAFLATLPPKN